MSASAAHSMVPWAKGAHRAVAILYARGTRSPDGHTDTVGAGNRCPSRHASWAWGVRTPRLPLALALALALATGQATGWDMATDGDRWRQVGPGRTRTGLAPVGEATVGGIMVLGSSSVAAQPGSASLLLWGSGFIVAVEVADILTAIIRYRRTRELQARRLAREGVVTLDAKKRQRGA